MTLGGWTEGGCMAEPRLLLELQDVQPAGGVRQIDQAASIDENVGGGDWRWRESARRGRRDKRRDLFWTERVGNAEHAQPRVLIRHENGLRALKAALRFSCSCADQTCRRPRSSPAPTAPETWRSRWDCVFRARRRPRRTWSHPHSLPGPLRLPRSAGHDPVTAGRNACHHRTAGASCDAPAAGDAPGSCTSTIVSPPSRHEP